MELAREDARTAGALDDQKAATHTPGPWHWDSDPLKGDPLGRVRFQVVARGRTITQCYYPSGDGQAEADTKLIAAAPDLLHALRCFMDDERFQVAVGGNPIVVDRMLAKARAVIAKAEGR